MTAPLASHGLIGDGASLAVAFAIGIAFGWSLERAGLGSARKLMGQFYLTDFTVFKVMFTAILTAMLGTFWLRALGFLDLARCTFPRHSSRRSSSAGSCSASASRWQACVRARRAWLRRPDAATAWLSLRACSPASR